MSISLSKMYQRLKKSIVSIEGVKHITRRYNRALPPFIFAPEEELEERKMSYGSGMIIHSSGYILTCFHVVDQMNDIRIKLGRSQNLYRGTVVWVNPEDDLAVLKISPTRKLNAVRFAPSNGASIGEKVFAVGNPFGFDHTLTIGILSGKNRTISTGNREYRGVLQTDTALNPGNSGGPLFNFNGRVIGMNAVIIQSYQNMGFSIPTQTFLHQIKRFLPSSSRSSKLNR